MVNCNKKYAYRAEKTPKERALRIIKKRTRYRFPLKGELCVICKQPAECHHHTTNPIKYDEFVFMCNHCHLAFHRFLRKNKILNYELSLSTN